MTPLTLSRRGLPAWTSEMLDSGKFFGPNILDFEGNFPSWDFAKSIPTVNIVENTKDFKIEMAAPGLEKKDFHISVENEMLTISSEKKEDVKEKKENFTMREFFYSSFSRSFRLPENCFPEKIDAKYENGILKLIIPKKEVSVTKPVKEIKIS